MNNKIDRTSVPEMIANYMQEKITSGAWHINEKIPSEAILSKELNVSRASLRTVISQFIALGILKAYQGKGTYLIATDVSARLGVQQPLTHSEFNNLANVLKYRLLIEPQAVLWLENCDEAEYQKLLDDLISTQINMKDEVGDQEQFIKSDLNFHLLIAQACGNDALYGSLNFIFESTMPSQVKLNELFGFKDGLLYHQLIIDCLVHNDLKRASNFMAEHLQNALDNLEHE